MCGIAGILNFSENHSNNLMFIQKITNTIKHRGPDDFNIYSNQEQGSILVILDYQLLIYQIMVHSLWHHLIKDM